MKINPLSNKFNTGSKIKVKSAKTPRTGSEDKVVLSKPCSDKGCIEEVKKGNFLKAVTGAFADIADTIGITGNDNTPPVSGNEETSFTPAEPREWNVLVYMAGDNTLEASMANNLKTLEKIGSDEKTNILVQFDRGMRQHKGISPWDGAKRFYITKQEGEGISSKVIKDLGDIDTSKSDPLTDFIVESHREYPAKHTLIIISNHGGGFTGIANDDTSKTVMSLPDLEKSLKNAKDALGKDKFDIVGFDACLMGQAEVAYQISDHAKIMIGSEETEGKDGWPYRGILDDGDNVINVIKSTIKTKNSVGPKELAKEIVDEASKTQSQIPTLAAIDLKEMGKIGNLASQFATTVKKTPGALEIVRKIAEKTESYSKVIPFIEPYGQFRDMGNFLEKVVDSPDLEGAKFRPVKLMAAQILPVLKKTVIAEQHSDLYGDSNGLSIYFPTDKPKPHKYGYDKTKWALDTQWDEMLTADQGMFTFGTNSIMEMFGFGDKWTYTPPPMFDEEQVRKNKEKDL